MKPNTTQKANHYMEQRLNWVKLVRNFISRFDYEHIELEDVSRYNEKENNQCTIIMELENGEVQREVITVNNA